MVWAWAQSWPRSQWGLGVCLPDSHIHPSPRPSQSPPHGTSHGSFPPNSCPSVYSLVFLLLQDPRSLNRSIYIWYTCIWASPAAQQKRIKNPHAMQETQNMQVRSLGWEDPLEESMATHCSVLAWRITWTRGTWQATVHRVAESWTRLKWLSMHTRIYVYIGLPGGLVVKNPPAKCWRNKRHGFDPWIGKIPWNRKWQPTAVFLPGKFHGQRRLAGYSSWSCKESDTSEWLSTHIYVCMCM